GFYDALCMVLPSGKVLVAPKGPSTYGGTLIYDPTLNTWSAGPTLVRGGYQDETSWVKLADNSILTIDPCGDNSERYIPSINAWIDDGVLPIPLWYTYQDVGGEIGAALLLPDGRAFFLGGNGHT